MSSPFTIVAKAGGSGEAAENTCEACTAVARLEVRPGFALALEIDVRLCADGELVALHDATLERTTNGRGAVRSIASSALGALVAGPRGERVPTLDAVLEASGELELVLEAHDDDPAFEHCFVRWLAAQPSRTRERLIVASERDAVVHAVRRAELGVRTAATAREGLLSLLCAYTGLVAAMPRGHAWFVPPRHRGLGVTTARWLGAVRRHGDPVWVWVIDSASEARRLAELGATGVFTTRPRALLHELTAAVT